MPEPENDLSRVGWNVETLRQYFSTLLSEQKEATAARFSANEVRYQQRFEASERAMASALLAAEKAETAALTAADKAVQKAEASNEKRFEAVNGFRAALGDMTNALMPRVEATARLDAMNEKIIDISQRLAGNDGAKSSTHQSQAAILAIGALIIALSTFVLTAYRGSPTAPSQILVSPPTTIVHPGSP